MAMLTDKQFLILAGAAAVAGYLVWKFGKKLVTEELNPLSDRNVVYDNVIGGVGRTVSGNEHWSLGVQVWEWLNPGAVQAERDLLKP